MKKSFREFLLELSLSLMAITATAILIVAVVAVGDMFRIEFLQSEGGIILSVILLGETFFLTFISYIAIRG